jgi:hypothetical protein
MKSEQSETTKQTVAIVAAILLTANVAGASDPKTAVEAAKAIVDLAFA